MQNICSCPFPHYYVFFFLVLFILRPRTISPLFLFCVSSSILSYIFCLFFPLSSCFLSPTTSLSLYQFSSHTSPSLSSVTSQALIDLFRPRLTVPSKIFQVAVVYFVHNSALLAPGCYSFLLHGVANFIYIFLVYRQMILLSTLLQFLRSFVNVKKCVSNCSSEKLHLS